ncbi:ribosomal L27e protein family-domain-containing protein [Hysterangium stoloniferum]|nr:ribosomal L27e protein family-domain-containing protein [Hysterangium stoloniferum]
MVKVYKPGKVAIVLQGRQAGKKVVVIKQLDEGTKERPYPHAVVAGIERYPRKVTKRMGAKTLAKRSKVKPFIKTVNYSHLFPTRYQLELEGLKGTVSTDTFKEVTQREDAKKTVKKLLEDRYQQGKNRWFFTPLRVRRSAVPLRCTCILSDLPRFRPVLSASVSVWAYDMGL